MIDELKAIRTTIVEKNGAGGDIKFSLTEINVLITALELADAHVAYIECVPETEEATHDRYDAALYAYTANRSE